MWRASPADLAATPCFFYPNAQMTGRRSGEARAKGSAMVRIYWYSLALIYLSLAVLGAALGYGQWGVGGAILCAVVGGMVASGVAIVLNTPERMESAIYIVLALLFLTLLVWSIVTFWGVRI